MFEVLSYFAAALALFGIVAASYELLGTVRAERAWVEAVRANSDVRQQIKDFRKESKLLQGTNMGGKYLDGVVAEYVRLLGDQKAIPDDARRRIEAALLQPSERGRSEYARKLVEEAMTGRVKIA